MPKDDNILEHEPTYATCPCGEEVILTHWKVLEEPPEVQYKGECLVCGARLILKVIGGRR